MSKHSKVSETIPSVLSIPEKLSGIAQKLLAFRFPLERRFSGRNVLLMLAAAVVLVLSVTVKAFTVVQAILQLAAVLIAAVPLCLQGWRQIRKRIVPIEELTILLAAILSITVKDTVAGVLILVFAGLLMETESYCLLHRDAAPDALQDAKLPLRHAVEKADEEKSPERRILASALLGFYALFVLAALIFGICTLFHLKDYAVWLKRCTTFLVLATPSAALFTSLLTHFGAICSAARADIAFEDDAVPEQLSRCRIFVFSKTGTVTDGQFRITETVPVGMSEQDLLRIAAIAECRSAHPIAAALKAAAGLDDSAVPEDMVSTKEIPGKGVSTFFSGHQIYVGNAGLLEDHGIWYRTPSKSGAAVHVAVDGTYRGYIMISDEVRENAFEALEEMRALGASNLVMLTGDVRSAARTLASSLNFDMVKPELSSEEKGSAVRYLRSVHGEKAKIACIGDGYHDSDMFEASDVSVCLEPGENVPPAQVTVDSDDILRIPLAYRICRETERMLLINTAGLAGIKILLAVLGAAAVLPTAAVAGIDCAAGMGAVIYALTSLTLDRKK